MNVSIEFIDRLKEGSSANELVFIMGSMSNDDKIACKVALQNDKELGARINALINQSPVGTTYNNGEASDAEVASKNSSNNQQLESLSIPSVRLDLGEWSFDKLGSHVEWNGDTLEVIAGPNPIIVKRLSDNKEMQVR